LVGAENDRPLLEVRFRSDGHPPFTEREREIHLNGTCGVKFWERLGSIIDPSLFLFDQERNVQRSTSNIQRFNSEWILVEHRALSVERWAFLS
jgi:hypothetical protein